MIECLLNTHEAKGSVPSTLKNLCVDTPRPHIYTQRGNFKVKPNVFFPSLLCKRKAMTRNVRIGILILTLTLNYYVTLGSQPPLLIPKLAIMKPLCSFSYRINERFKWGIYLNALKK